MTCLLNNNAGAILRDASHSVQSSLLGCKAKVWTNIDVALGYEKEGGIETMSLCGEEPTIKDIESEK